MEKWMKWFLIGLIVFGIIMRFLSLNSYIYYDETQITISAIKFHHESFDACRYFQPEHPPLARWLIGLPSMFVSEYNMAVTYEEGKHFGNYEFTYMFYRELAANLIPTRFMAAIIGFLTVMFVYILTIKIFNSGAALFSSALCSLSLYFLFYSTVNFMEIYMAFFSVA